MKRGARFQIVCIICVCGLAIILSIGLFAANDRGTEAKQHTPDKDRAAIETLHRLDVQTTLTDKADELAKLWDADAVRIQPGSPAEVTKAVIYANDKRWEAGNKNSKTLCYKTEIQDIQIAGEWAFEWGYFSYRKLGGTQSWSRQGAACDETAGGRLVEVRARHGFSRDK